MVRHNGIQVTTTSSRSSSSSSSESTVSSKALSSRDSASTYQGTWTLGASISRPYTRMRNSVSRVVCSLRHRGTVAVTPGRWSLHTVSCRRFEICSSVAINSSTASWERFLGRGPSRASRLLWVPCESIESVRGCDWALNPRNCREVSVANNNGAQPFDNGALVVPNRSNAHACIAPNTIGNIASVTLQTSEIVSASLADSPLQEQTDRSRLGV